MRSALAVACALWAGVAAAGHISFSGTVTAISESIRQAGDLNPVFPPTPFDGVVQRNDVIDGFIEYDDAPVEIFMSGQQRIYRLRVAEVDFNFHAWRDTSAFLQVDGSRVWFHSTESIYRSEWSVELFGANLPSSPPDGLPNLDGITWTGGKFYAARIGGIDMENHIETAAGNITSVHAPEPATWATLTIGLLLLARTRRLRI